MSDQLPGFDLSKEWRVVYHGMASNNPKKAYRICDGDVTIAWFVTEREANEVAIPHNAAFAMARRPGLFAAPSSYFIESESAIQSFQAAILTAAPGPNKLDFGKWVYVEGAPICLDPATTIIEGEKVLDEREGKR